jgi:predicted nucleic acid-binding protein
LIASWRVVEQAVINASPLIFLSRSGHLGLLQEFAKEVWIPEAVAMEILACGHDDVTARAMDATPWLSIQPPISISQAVANWRLGAGESAVIALAHRCQRW